MEKKMAVASQFTEIGVAFAEIFHQGPDLLVLVVIGRAGKLTKAGHFPAGKRGQDLNEFVARHVVLELQCTVTRSLSHRVTMTLK